jgi:hypothetical protein
MAGLCNFNGVMVVLTALQQGFVSFMTFFTTYLLSYCLIIPLTYCLTVFLYYTVLLS